MIYIQPNRLYQKGLYGVYELYRNIKSPNVVYGYSEYDRYNSFCYRYS